MDEPRHGAVVRCNRPADGRSVSIVLLIRHGHCEPVGRSIAGRSPGVHLDETGRGQARTLADALAGLPLAAVYSSPLERAQETAAPLAEGAGVTLRISYGLEELDYGAWTGRTLESLAGEPLWVRYNSERGATRIPGGETMREVVERAAAAVAEMSAAHQQGIAAAVTHGDVIRALLATYLGMGLDHMLRLEVAPGSVSAVRFAPQPQILTVNWVPDLAGAC